MANEKRLDQVAVNMKIERVKKGLTQQQVADYLEVTQQTYSKYEKGSPIDNKIIDRLCDLYNITADQLLGRKSINSTEQSYNVSNSQLDAIIKKVLKEVEGEKKDD